VSDDTDPEAHRVTDGVEVAEEEEGTRVLNYLSAISRMIRMREPWRTYFVSLDG